MMTNNGKNELGTKQNKPSEWEDSVHQRFEDIKERVKNYTPKKKLVSTLPNTEDQDFDVDEEPTVRQLNPKSEEPPTHLLSAPITPEVKGETNSIEVASRRRMIGWKQLLLVFVLGVVSAGGFFTYRFFSVNKLATTSKKVRAKTLPVFTKEPLLSQNLSTLFNTVKAIAISERNTLAISDGKTVKIVALNNSSLVTTFSYKSVGQITHLAFSQDGHTLISGDNRGSIQVWQLGRKDPLYTLNKHSPLAIKSLALAVDGNTLVSADLGGNIFVWDLASKKSQGLFGHSASVNSVVVSSDLGLVVSGGNDSTVRLWDVKTREQLAVLTDNHAVFSVALSPDGKTVYSGNRQGVIHTWDTTTSKLLKTVNRQREKISNLAIIGSALISTSNDGTVVLFNRTTGYDYSHLSERHNLYVNFLAVRPDMGLIITGDPKQIKAWTLSSK
ncbi:MAG: WD40 repeat domain-containing protein [Prochloraceae cyanobacterium]